MYNYYKEFSIIETNLVTVRTFLDRKDRFLMSDLNAWTKSTGISLRVQYKLVAAIFAVFSNNQDFDKAKKSTIQYILSDGEKCKESKDKQRVARQLMRVPSKDIVSWRNGSSCYYVNDLMRQMENTRDRNFFLMLFLEKPNSVSRIPVESVFYKLAPYDQDKNNQIKEFGIAEKIHYQCEGDAIEFYSMLYSKLKKHANINELCRLSTTSNQN